MASQHDEGTDADSGSLTETSSSSGESDDEAENQDANVGSSTNGAKLAAATPPIRKDGMAVCEKCGNVGVKHAFYSKTKRFCSLACARSMPKQSGGKTSASSGKTPKRTAGVSGHGSVQKSKMDLTGSFDWKPHLSRPDFVAAPVWCFKHVALSKCWSSWINTTVNMKVEIENKDYESLEHVFPCCYWVASVIKVAGYMGLLRYEGFGTDSSKDMWINLCSEEIHPVGWCASQGKPLIPPKTIEHKCSDWKEFLMRRLTGARTLPVDFHAKVQESLKSRFQVNTKLEVVDKNRISAVRVATIEEIVGGRLHISYEGAEEWDEGFWCHERSPLIHPIGWAQIVGHDLRASPEYAKSSLQKTLTKKFDPDDATWDLFEPVVNLPEDLQFKEGMKLEAIDPLNLSTICVATVTRVLRNNYLMIGIDGMMSASGSDWFCYHATSPCIFPVGFCELNNIELTPPRGYKGEFKWYNYLRDTKSTAAPVALFKRDIPNHGFKEGMHVEAVDLMEPRLICVASITKVVGRLLRVHFDGWDDTYDQWCDCESPDLFPVGWCILVGYRLEPPRTQGSLEGALRRKKKYQMYKGPRKKKKRMWHQQQSKGSLQVAPFQPIHASMTLKIDTGLTSGEEVIQIGGPLHGEQDHTGAIRSDSNPEEWGLLDVAQFLRINECGAYCQAFNQQKIDGKRLLSLTKEEIMSLTGMKVGPSLKIYDLIQQFKRTK